MIASAPSFADLAAALAGVVAALASLLVAAATARLRKRKIESEVWDPFREDVRVHLERSIGDVATADYVAHGETRTEVDRVLRNRRRTLEGLG
jgi:hypothetical protein